MDIIKTVALVGVLPNAMISDKDAAQCTWNKPRERETIRFTNKCEKSN